MSLVNKYSYFAVNSNNLSINSNIKQKKKLVEVTSPTNKHYYFIIESNISSTKSNREIINKLIVKKTCIHTTKKNNKKYY